MKKSKSYFIKILFYGEDVEGNKVDFIGKTTTYTVISK